MSRIGARGAFRIFIRHQLETAIEDGNIDLTSDQLEQLASGIEDDTTFYDRLNSFLSDYIDDFGENYGL